MDKLHFNSLPRPTFPSVTHLQQRPQDNCRHREYGAGELTSVGALTVALSVWLEKEKRAMANTPSFPETSPEEIASESASLPSVATIKRHLLRKKRLTGNSLEFALTVASEDSAIGEKLKAGRVLTRLPQGCGASPAPQAQGDLVWRSYSPQLRSNNIGSALLRASRSREGDIVFETGADHVNSLSIDVFLRWRMKRGLTNAKGSDEPTGR